MVAFSAEKRYMEEGKTYLEPRGIPTFAEIEEPFELLSILSRCYTLMNRCRI